MCLGSHFRAIGVQTHDVSEKTEHCRRTFLLRYETLAVKRYIVFSHVHSTASNSNNGISIICYS